MESLTPPNGNYEEIIYDLVFAYANKDEYPHSCQVPSPKGEGFSVNRPKQSKFT